MLPHIAGTTGIIQCTGPAAPEKELQRPMCPHSLSVIDMSVCVKSLVKAWVLIQEMWWHLLEGGKGEERKWVRQRGREREVERGRGVYFKDFWQASSGLTGRLRPREELHSNSKAVSWQNSCFCGEVRLFLLRPSTDWMRATHNMGGHLLYSECNDFNVSLFEIVSSLKHLNFLTNYSWVFWPGLVNA
jgi:hypothetical protein